MAINNSKVYSIPAVDQRDWTAPVTDLSTVQAALGVDKSAATVRALTATGINRISVPECASAISFRFLTGADANADVLNLYAIRGDDHYELVCGITLTGGKQTDGDKFFCDTAVVVASTEVWPTSLSFSSQGDDSVAKLTLNTHGYSEFLFIATTLADALEVQIARV